VSAVTGITLVSAQAVVPLGGFRIDTNAPAVGGVVPSGVPPGLYFVHLESERRRGPASQGVTFRVVGRGQHFPGPVDLLASNLQSVATATTRDFFLDWVAVQVTYQ
jgi:hypothetical protein